MTPNRLLLALTGTAFAVAIGACSSDGAQVADKISDEVASRLDIEAPKATCPEDAKAEKGTAFRCNVVVEGQRVAVDVNFDTAKHFTMSFVGDLVNFEKPKLEAAVAAQAKERLGQDVTFDCPGETVTLIKSAGTIECHGKAADGTSGTATVGVDEDQNPVLQDLVAD